MSAVKITLDYHKFKNKYSYIRYMLADGNIYFVLLYISLSFLRKFIYQDPANLNYSNYIGGWLIGNLFRQNQ